MQLLRGTSALSSFRIQKLLSASSSAIRQLDCEFLYIADADDSFSDDHKSLCELLSAEYGASLLTPQGKLKLMFIVTPRVGTISPWSTKATDIAKHCTLSSIKRLERGRVYLFELERELQEGELKHLKSVIHDKMTESVFSSYDELSEIFAAHTPAAFNQVDISSGGKEALHSVNNTLGLALSSEEIDYLYDRYSNLQRNPSDIELMMFAQANSEHCRHKIFNADWTIDGQAKDSSLFGMIKNTYRCNSENILSAYSDNAAVIRGSKAGRFFANNETNIYDAHEEDIHILMKVETHNHPTAISPFPGAATGSGGEIRDEGATGRGAKPKAGLCGFTVSNLRVPYYTHTWETSLGKPDRIESAFDIMIEAPIGAAAFNNEFGRPNIAGYFRSFEHPLNETDAYGYHKPIMIAGGLGNIRDEHVLKGRIKNGDKVIVLGGPAMLIGLGGGAASSMATGTSEENLDFASVQRDNPEMERRCQEVINSCWSKAEENPIAFIHDVGAGGLSNAIPELVNDGGCGGKLELREVPNLEPGMSPLEIWCNEAQERYVLAVTPENLKAFENICERERCPYAVVGQVIEERWLQLSDSHFKNNPIDIPMDLLFGKSPKMIREVKSVEPETHELVIDKSCDELLELVLKHPAVSDKSFLITIGDRSVGGLVCRDQMVGPWQVPVADCGITAASFDSVTGEAMAMGERTPVATLSSAAAARLALGEAITNIASARISAISDIRLSANWMAAAGHDGEDANLYAAVETIGTDLCPRLGITIPVGKDSMSMKTLWQDDSGEKSVVSPVSLIISAFAPVTDVRKSLTPSLIANDNTQLILIDLGFGKQRLGASILAQVLNQLGEEPADLDNVEAIGDFFACIQALNDNKLVEAYHDRSDGGLITTLVEMAFAGQCGLDLELNETDIIPYLFNEELGAVIQVANENMSAVNDLIAKHKLEACAQVLGKVTQDKKLKLNNNTQVVLEKSLTELREFWSGLSYHMQRNRDNPQCAEQELAAKLAVNDPGISPILTFDPAERMGAAMVNVGKRPKIAILREQGVNGHVEMAAAFHYAGFEAFDVHMSDLEAKRQELNTFNGLVACGGFSYGDVLGAGLGWANSILYHDKLRAMFEAYFNDRMTFALGVCNGCQMMAQLKGIIPGAADWPLFKRNLSEQFEARVSMLKLEQSPSAFFNSMDGSIIPVPIAHGEGRASFENSESLARLRAANQVAAVYVDNHGELCDSYPANPNGSTANIAAVTSSDGRNTIMMPHPERAFLTTQFSYAPASWPKESPWLRMFENAKAWISS